MQRISLLWAGLASVNAKNIGLLFASFGDAESCECVESYFPNALAQLVNYEVPTPPALRPMIAHLIWKASRKETLAMYTAISPTCNTSYQTNARAQGAAVAAALQSLRPQDEFKVYVGYNFIHGPGCPSGVTVVDQARLALADGVDTLLVVNQNGAQQSNTTIGVAYDDLAPELKSNVAWNGVQVIGIDDYSTARGFNELLIDFVSGHFDESLGKQGVRADQTCLLFACHGNPSRIGKLGDPGETLMRENYAVLSKHFAAAGFDVHLAFQNHGGKGTTFPQNLFPWSSPPDTDVVPSIAKNAACSHVLITGTIAFVVDNSETFFDEAIDDLRMLAGKPAAVTPSFNADARFAKFLATVLSDTLEGKWPVRKLNQVPGKEQALIQV